MWNGWRRSCGVADTEEDGDLFQWTPKTIAALSGRKVEQVVAGDYHSLVLAEGGEVLSFGWGKHGRLGHSDSHEQLAPRTIEALIGTHIQEVTCGYRCSVLRAASGEVVILGLKPCSGPEPAEGRG